MYESEKWKWSHSVVSDSERPHGLQFIRLLHPWDFPGKSTGVGRHCLLHSFVDGHLICMAEVETRTENKWMGIPTGKGWSGKNWEIGIDTCVLLMCVCVLSRSVVADSLWPHGCSPPAPLSMGLSRQDYRGGLPVPSPGDPPDPEIEPRPLTLQADSLPSEPPGSQS